MSEFKYFKLEDFNCQETGENEMSRDFIHRLDELREACGFPFIITSGYRSPSHSIEKRKEKAGKHAQGIAADIKAANGYQRYKIVEEAIKMGFNGIGVARTFIHVDSRICGADKAPVMWCY
jgi:zinc D-Ala-D-Ala carboxypeptidase